MTSKGGEIGRDKSRGRDMGMRARKEKGQVVVMMEGRRGLNKQGNEVTLGFYMHQSTKQERTAKGGSKMQSSDQSYDTGGERWYVYSLSYPAALEIDRSRKFYYFSEMSMKTKSKGRHRQVIGNPIYGKKGLYSTSYDGAPSRKKYGSLRKEKSKPKKGCNVGRVAKSGRVGFPASHRNQDHVCYIGNLSKAKSRTPLANRWESSFPRQPGRRDVMSKYIEKQQEGHRGK